MALTKKALATLLEKLKIRYVCDSCGRRVPVRYTGHFGLNVCRKCMKAQLTKTKEVS